MTIEHSCPGPLKPHHVPLDTATALADHQGAVGEPPARSLHRLFFALFQNQQREGSMRLGKCSLDVLWKPAQMIPWAKRYSAGDLMRDNPREEGVPFRRLAAVTER